ncbi:MAG: ABC transporter transmembrane domain-containing protein, partial [Gemmataceae bacterium]
MNGTDAKGIGPPTEWHDEIAGQLQKDEMVLAWFEPDLNDQLHYARGLVVLTDRRVLARTPGEASASWRSWPLTESITLRTAEYGSAAALELVDATARLACWRYTASKSTAAHRLVQKLASWRRSRQDGLDTTTAVCPSCGAAIDADEGRCAACAAGPAKPSLSALFRLVAFARPRASLIALGFVLTLAATTARLVPPYLTKPLLDNVLIPHQEGRGGDFSLAKRYLGGLVAAALLAWLLDWAKLYVLAWVSERISADLRSRTYAHLQRLSLEFFGGKRTGDLIARISNDTERLCNFLSINLIDFASDILMIVMTAATLLWINPLLALAALCPFPLIVWMVARVRGRLLRGYRQAGAAWGAMTSV